MERLTIDQMENLVGGNEYCANLYTTLFIGPFQGSDELYIQTMGFFDTHCGDYEPPTMGG